jgi:hypothetical protein
MTDRTLDDVLARLAAQERELAALRRRVAARRRFPRRARLVALALLALCLALVPLALLAADPGGYPEPPLTDKDQDPNNPHNVNIDAIYGLGITKGCDPTHYCPKNTVTREEMASFLARTATFQSQGLATTPQLLANEADANLGAGASKDYMQAILTVPGNSDYWFLVRVGFTGYAFQKSVAGCPCLLDGQLRADGARPQLVARASFGTTPTEIVGGGDAPANRKDLAGSAVFLVQPGKHTFTMSLARALGTAADVGFAAGNLQAQIIPFNGSNTLVPNPLKATLSGANQVPPVTTQGSGTARVSIDGATGVICYVITVANLSSEVVEAHIHQGAAGTNGGVVVNFHPPANNGSTNGCTSVDPAVAQQIRANPAGFYVNIHTVNIDGEIRGQLQLP